VGVLDPTICRNRLNSYTFVNSRIFCSSTAFCKFTPACSTHLPPQGGHAVRRQGQAITVAEVGRCVQHLHSLGVGQPVLRRGLGQNEAVALLADQHVSQQPHLLGARTQMRPSADTNAWKLDMAS